MIDLPGMFATMKGNRTSPPIAMKAVHACKKERWNIRYRNLGSSSRNNHSQNSHLCSIPVIHHPHCPCTHMNVFRRRNLMTHFNRLNPGMSHHFLNRKPVFRIGFQHLANEAATMSGIEVIDCRRAWWHGMIWAGTSANIGGIELVGYWLRCAPWKFLEVQAVVDYPACPDIDQPCVIRCHHRRKVNPKIFCRQKDATMKGKQARQY